MNSWIKSLRGDYAVGVLGVVTRGKIQGWAYFPERDEDVNVVVEVDGRRLDTIVANVPRPDLVASGRGTKEKCGFCIMDFDSRALVSGRVLRAYVEQTGQELANSPFLLSDIVDVGTNGVEKRLIAFVHIPKTAGTSFRVAANHYFGKEKVLNDYGLNVLETSQLVRDTIYNGNPADFVEAVGYGEFRFLSGHFSIKKYYNLLGRQAMWCAFLRDPVQRVISEFQHFVRLYDYKGTVEEFCVNDAHRNKQSSHLESINLGELDFIGITEEYAESIELFNRKTGFDFRCVAANMARNTPISRHEVDDVTKALIEENNQLDRELYDEALELYSEARKILRAQ